ncbi:MAG: DUF2029 domain-containing protein [Chloroflexi bacterium]|nr:DUF2029 domain-containing protein [Chloroflexota bacterium]
MRSAASRFVLRWRMAGLLALLSLVGLIFAGRTLWPARFATAHGFPLYYTAGWLYATGQWGPAAYDDEWFGDRVESFTQNGVREIYAPGPPLLAVFFALLAGLDLATAREAWAWLNVPMLMLSIWLIGDAQARFEGGLWRAAGASFALLAAPVHEHFRLGQAYILLLLLFALAFWLVQHQHEASAGIALGMAFATKLSGLPLWFILLARHPRRTSVAAVLTAGSLGLIGVVVMGLPTWLAFVRTLIERLTDYPLVAVTAFQSTSGFFHHLFAYDALWNPTPIGSQPWLANVLTWSVFVGATIATMRRARRAVFDLAFAAGLTLSVILLPLAEEYHYVLLILPIAVMLARVLRRPDQMSDLMWLTTIVFLIGWPLPYTAPELARGWSALLAYPRLYGGWLLWLWSVKRMNVERSQS